MKLVRGVVRTTSIERLVHALERIGIRGMTISEVKGLGHEVRLNNPYSIHDKIEIIVEDDRADEVVKTIMNTTETGLAGDGIVMVLTLDSFVHIRSGGKTT